MDGQGVGLGSAAGEDYLVRSSDDQTCDLLPGASESAAGLFCEMVAAGGIAEMSGQVRQHRLDHTRVYRCGGVVV
jgi:hypothetical protein